MYGFDTASSLAEESHDPRRNAPRAILRALFFSFLLGGLILLFALMSAPDLADPAFSSLGGLQALILAVLGDDRRFGHPRGAWSSPSSCARWRCTPRRSGWRSR